MSLTFVTVGSIDFALGSYAVLAAAVGSSLGGVAGIALAYGLCTTLAEHRSRAVQRQGRPRPAAGRGLVRLS